jgi:hypothetical protein
MTRVISTGIVTSSTVIRRQRCSVFEKYDAFVLIFVTSVQASQHVAE